MYIRNINNIDYIKVNDTATQIQLKIFDNLNNPLDLKSAMQVVVVIGNHNGRILTKIPDLLDDTGVLEFGLDNGDLLEVGHNLLEVHIIMPNGEKFVAPSKGYYKLSATRSIDTLGEEVTTVTLDYFLEEANRALNEMNAKVEYVNQTANDLRQEVSTAIQYVDDTVDDLRQEVSENLDSLVTQEVDNKMTPFVEDVNERLAETTVELENKVSISAFVSGLSTKRDKGIKLDERDMSDEFLQQIAGNAPIHSVPADLSVDAGKLLLPNADVVWELGNVSYSGGVNQDLEGYIRTKDYIYAPKGTAIFTSNNMDYKYSVHLYDIETKTRFERVWEPSATKYIVPTTCYVRVTVRTNPTVPVTHEIFGTMKSIVTLNKLLYERDVVETIQKIKDHGKNNIFALSFFSQYGEGTRAESVKNIPLSGVSKIIVDNKSVDFNIGIRQKDTNNTTVIDNGWILQGSKNKIDIQNGVTSLQVVFRKFDNSAFTLNDIPFNLFSIYFDNNLNDNKLNYFNVYLKEYIDSASTKRVTKYSIDSPLFTPKSFKLVGHRGLSGLQPENTIPAFEECGKKGIFGVETDIRKTADGHFVCMHDATVDRTTNGVGNVSDMTLEQIKELTIDYGVNIENHENLKVPTLEEMLLTCAKYGLVPLLHLYVDVGDEPAIVDVVNSLGFESTVIYTSTSPTMLGNLERISNSLTFNLGGAASDLSNISPPTRNYQGMYYDQSVYYNYPNAIKDIHKQRMIAAAWVVNDQEVADDLFNKGIDLIATDVLY